MRPFSMERIKFQEMGRDRAVSSDFIDVNELEFWRVPASAESESSHASEAVDGDAFFHKVEELIRVDEVEN